MSMANLTQKSEYNTSYHVGSKSSSQQLGKQNDLVDLYFSLHSLFSQNFIYSAVHQLFLRCDLRKVLTKMTCHVQKRHTKPCLSRFMWLWKRHAFPAVPVTCCITCDVDIDMQNITES